MLSILCGRTAKLTEEPIIVETLFHFMMSNDSLVITIDRGHSKYPAYIGVVPSHGGQLVISTFR